jgi:hypothetical protein
MKKDKTKQTTLSEPLGEADAPSEKRSAAAPQGSDLLLAIKVVLIAAAVFGSIWALDTFVVK